jgi:hypothetical protein
MNGRVTHARLGPARAWLVLLGSLAMHAGCGPDFRCVELSTRLGHYTVPTDLDQLHVRLVDGEGVFVERTFPLQTDDTTPTLVLCPGPRTPLQMTAVVYGLNTSTSPPQVVAQSAPVDLRFDGSMPAQVVSLP